MNIRERFGTRTVGPGLAMLGGVFVAAHNGLPAVGIDAAAFASPGLVLVGGLLMLLGGIVLGSTLL